MTRSRIRRVSHRRGKATNWDLDMRQGGVVKEKGGNAAKPGLFKERKWTKSRQNGGDNTLAGDMRERREKTRQKVGGAKQRQKGEELQGKTVSIRAVSAERGLFYRGGLVEQSTKTAAVNKL